jgi:hypothetical protein
MAAIGFEQVLIPDPLWMDDGQSRNNRIASALPTRTKPLARRTLRVYSLKRRWSLEEQTVQRYDDVDMSGDTSDTSMNINDSLIPQLLLLQRLANQSRFNSHSSPRPPQTPAASS